MLTLYFLFYKNYYHYLLNIPDDTISNIISNIISILVSLITFFAFPILQYLILKQVSKKEGLPEIWYIPKYGCFRLVVRNTLRSKVLRDIKTCTSLRTIILPSKGCSVPTYVEDLVYENKMFFLFPGNDYVLLSFKLKKDKDFYLILTDKLGRAIKRFPICKNTQLITEYTAILHNLFNFNISLAKRIEISGNELKDIFETIQKDNSEQLFKIRYIRHIE